MKREGRGGGGGGGEEGRRGWNGNKEGKNFEINTLSLIRPSIIVKPRTVDTRRKIVQPIRWGPLGAWWARQWCRQAYKESRENQCWHWDQRDLGAKTANEKYSYSVLLHAISRALLLFQPAFVPLFL